MSVKKAYQDVVAFLEQNKDQTVSDILSDVVAMCSAKAGGGGAETVFRDADGEVVAIFCYYHKRWEPTEAVEFGKKAGSATGLNNMCKEGTSAWSKRERTAKKAREELLARVASGEVAPDEIPAEQDNIEAGRQEILDREDAIGFDTLDELKAFIEDGGDFADLIPEPENDDDDAE